MVYRRLGHIKGSINVAAVNGVNGHNEFKLKFLLAKSEFSLCFKRLT